MGVASGLANDLYLKPVAMANAEETCGEVAVGALQRVLDSYYEARASGGPAVLAHAKLCVHMSLSLALVDVGMGKALSRVSVITSLSSSHAIGRLADGVPLEVFLPRSLWLLLALS